MGNVVPRCAGPKRIFDDFETCLRKAVRQGGPVQATANARLSTLAVGVRRAAADLENDTGVAAAAEEELLALDGGSDLVVGAVLDEVWNALGRPASSIEFALIAGHGKAQWTEGDPRDQATLMFILAERLRQTTAPPLEAGKDSWAQRIQDCAEAQQRAAAAVKAAEAKLSVTQGVGRAIADVAQVCLTRFKRDLKNLGLTEVQIHEVIPGYVPKSRVETEPTAPTAPTTATPATAPTPASTPGPKATEPSR